MLHFRHVLYLIEEMFLLLHVQDFALGDDLDSKDGPALLLRDNCLLSLQGCGLVEHCGRVLGPHRRPFIRRLLAYEFAFFSCGSVLSSFVIRGDE